MKLPDFKMPVITPTEQAIIKAAYAWARTWPLASRLSGKRQSELILRVDADKRAKKGRGK